MGVGSNSREMRRRDLIVAGCAGCATAFAGCSSDAVPVGANDPRHPFADATVRVRIVNDSDTDHDVEANARESLDYWAEHASEFTGFDVDFEVVREDPQLTIAYVDSPDPHCRDVEGFSERVLGCAPVLRPGRRVPEDLTAYVVAGARPYGKVRTTTKHEIGHVLGLYHDDEPRHVMSNRPEDRIPQFQLRIDIWETVLAATERSAAAGGFYDLGVDNWRQGRYEAAEASFGAAAEDFAAARELVGGARGRTDEFEGHPEVETVDLDDLRGHLDRLRSRMAAAEGFAGRMAAASAAAADGDREAERDRLGEANEHIREYNAIGPVELREVAIALGLVRGFDRDEPVVEVDEDEELADADAG